MATITLGLIMSPQFQQSFTRLLGQSHLPLRTSFKLRKIAQQLRGHVRQYEEGQRQLLERSAARTEDGAIRREYSEQHQQDMTVLAPEQVERYTQELTALAATQVQIDELNEADLGDRFDLSPQDIIALEFITED